MVGASGQSKEGALKWYEDDILGTVQELDGSITTIFVFLKSCLPSVYNLSVMTDPIAGVHYSAAWIAKVFAKANQSGSSHWIADN